MINLGLCKAMHFHVYTCTAPILLSMFTVKGRSSPSSSTLELEVFEWVSIIFKRNCASKKINLTEKNWKLKNFILSVPELDTPGHTNSLQKSYPELLTACYGRRSGLSGDALRSLLIRSTEAKNFTSEKLTPAGSYLDETKASPNKQDWLPNENGFISPKSDNDEHISLSASTLYASESSSSSLSAAADGRLESVLVLKSSKKENEETTQNGTESFGYSPYTPNYPFHSTQELLDPSRNQTYEFLNDLLSEFRKYFVDNFIHLGMDGNIYNIYKYFYGFY